MKQRKLLIVDDCDMNRCLLKAYCQEIGQFEIFEAFDGQDALDQCNQIEPDIILMDIMMPRLDGIEASKQIKQIHPDTVIIAVSTMEDANLHTTLQTAGIATCLSKPINQQQLHNQINHYLKY